jgi:hypothetical protein
MLPNVPPPLAPPSSQPLGSSSNGGQRENEKKKKKRKKKKNKKRKVHLGTLNTPRNVLSSPCIEVSKLPGSIGQGEIEKIKRLKK